MSKDKEKKEDKAEEILEKEDFSEEIMGEDEIAKIMGDGEEIIEEDEEEFGEIIEEEGEYYPDDFALKQFLSNPWKKDPLGKVIAHTPTLESAVPETPIFQETFEEDHGYLVEKQDERGYVKPEMRLSTDELYRSVTGEVENTILEEQKKLHQQRRMEEGAFSKSFEMSQAMKNKEQELYTTAEIAKDKSMRRNLVKDINAEYQVR
ncbi:hypothetical protein HOD29_06690 [archaeon]|jgi:hypothetical protein|nr:hypothetical protein [archaeon]